MSSDHDQVEKEALADAHAAQSAQARSFSIDPSFASAPMAPTYPPLVEPPPRERAPVDDISQLEDLYVRFPVGNGQYTLRVERVSPKQYAGVHCKGVLCDLDQQITLSEFRDMFGGGEYTVYIRSNKDGVVRTPKELRFSIPGAPKITHPVHTNDAHMSNTGNPGVGVQHVVGAAETMLRHSSEAERRATASSAALLGVINESADHRAQVVGDALRGQITALQTEISALRNEIVRHREENDKLRRDNIEAERRFHSELNRAETQREIDMRGRHEQETNRMRDTHAAALETMRRDYEAKIEAQRVRSEEDLRRRDDRERDERARASDDTKRDLASAKAQFEMQIASLQRDLDRERNDARNNLDRELRSKSDTHETVLTSIREQYKMQLEHLRTTLAAAQAAESNARTELERLRRELHKPASKQIEDAQNLLDMVRPETDKDEGPTSWTAVAAEVGKSVIPSLAQIIAGGVRPPPGAMPVPHPPPSGQHALPPHPGMHRPAPPPQAPPQPQRPKPRWMQGPRGPGDGSALPPGADAPVAPARPRARVPIASAATAQRATAPFAGEPMSTPPPSPPSPSAQPMQSPAPAAQPQPAPPPAAENRAFQEIVNEVFARATVVIESDEMPPAVFANEFVQMLGADNALAVVTHVNTDDVISQIDTQTGGTSPILSVRGRRYIKDLWAEVAKLLGGR